MGVSVVVGVVGISCWNWLSESVVGIDCRDWGWSENRLSEFVSLLFLKLFVGISCLCCRRSACCGPMGVCC